MPLRLRFSDFAHLRLRFLSSVVCIGAYIASSAHFTTSILRHLLNIPNVKITQELEKKIKSQLTTRMEKARAFDPFGHAGFDPSGKIRMTP